MKKNLDEMELLQRIMKHSRRHGECILWKGCTNKGGKYGQIRIGGKTYYAHRVVYELMHGQVPANKHVKQTCRKTLCVNPDHLVLVSEARLLDAKPNKERRKKNGKTA